MGIADFLSDLYDSVTSSIVTDVHADAPEDDKDGSSDEDSSEGKEEGGDDEPAEEGEGEGGDDAGDEEEEEEEEPVDPKPQLEEECARSAACIGYKHHFDECVERVTAQSEDPDHKGPKEDCVEEFFHLQHCATQCAAPKLFKQLK